MRRRTRGNMVIEAALWIPVMILLLVGMVQLGKITYIYYSLKKAVYSAARYLSVQQGVNFCDLPNDPAVTAALQFAVTGTTDGSGAPLISNLTTDMFSGLHAVRGRGDGRARRVQRLRLPHQSPPRPDYIMVTHAHRLHGAAADSVHHARPDSAAPLRWWCPSGGVS